MFRLGWRCGLAALFAGVVSIGASTSCGDDAFACIDDTDCAGVGAGARCEGSGFCSADDLTCPGGRRYGEHASSSLAGECVDGGVASATVAMTESSITLTTSDTLGETTTDGASSDDTVTIPTVNGYGRCETSEDCAIDGSVCVTNGDNRMCAPPCTTALSPSTECPVDIEGGDDVGCLYTDGMMTAVRCFVLCNDILLCPTGMTCVEPVCTWSGP